MGLRSVAARVALAPAAVAPILLLLCYRTGLFQFLTASRLLAFVPGAAGVYIRRLFYKWTLEECGDSFYVEWMTVLKSPAIRVGRRVAIGSFCFLAECELRDDVLVAQHTMIQGGQRTHGFDRLDMPIGEQTGEIRRVTIGPDVWIGVGARILADVAPGTVVGAGAVVTRLAESNAILAGVPARTIRLRGTPRGTPQAAGPEL